MVDPSTIPLLPAHTWETSYRHKDGNLVRLFYVPALSCAAQYDRTTVYFSADASALAARGIERLIANGGKMRLIVGCTLDPDADGTPQEGGLSQLLRLMQALRPKARSLLLLTATPMQVHPVELCSSTLTSFARSSESRPIPINSQSRQYQNRHA